MNWKGSLYALNYKSEVTKRYFLIRPNIVNQVVIIQNGKKFRKLKVALDHTNKKLGSFFFTKKKPHYLKTKIRKKYKNRKK